MWICFAFFVMLCGDFVRSFQCQRGTVTNHQSRTTLLMGKKIPIQFRGEMRKYEKASRAKAAYDANLPKDVPVFNIFAKGNGSFYDWVPCGSFVGEKSAGNLVNAWSSGFMTDMYKNQLDQGIARSIFSQEEALVKAIQENVRIYRKLPKEQIIFGYKIEFEGLEEKMGKQNITILTKGMEKSWLDNVKDGVTNVFNFAGEGDDDDTTEANADDKKQTNLAPAAAANTPRTKDYTISAKTGKPIKFLPGINTRRARKIAEAALQAEEAAASISTTKSTTTTAEKKGPSSYVIPPQRSSASATNPATQTAAVSATGTATMTKPATSSNTAVTAPGGFGAVAPVEEEKNWMDNLQDSFNNIFKIKL